MITGRGGRVVASAGARRVVGASRTVDPAGEDAPPGWWDVRVDDRMVFTAIVFVLTSGCAWRHLPPSFGVTVPTAHRRFIEWTQAGLWRRLHQAVLMNWAVGGLIGCSRAVLDGASKCPREKGEPIPLPESGGSRQVRVEDPCVV